MAFANLKRDLSVNNFPILVSHHRDKIREDHSAARDEAQMP